jgi:dolichol-phosphate mannosyltransferase
MAERPAPETMLVSIVVPVYNEESGLPQLFARLKDVAAQLDVKIEVLYVDDGSQDQTVQLCRSHATEDSRFKLVRLSRNFGHQAAISAGLVYAAGDAVIIMDGDLQDPPEAIPLFVARWLEGFEVVYAVRRKRPEGWLKRTAYWLFYRALGWLSEVRVPLDSGDFGLMDRRVVSMLRQMPERSRFLRGLRAWVGLRQVGVEVDRGARVAGASKYTFTKLRGLAMDGLVSFSYAPLKLATRTGFVVSAGAFVFAAWVIVLRLGWGIDIAGWASLVVVILFLGGIQLITIGILGEYVGRIYDEVKRRPLFIVADTVNVESPQSTDAGWDPRMDRRL